MGGAATPSRAHSPDQLWLRRAQKLSPVRKGRKKGVFRVLDLRSCKTGGKADFGRAPGPRLGVGGEGSPLGSAQLASRPRERAHLCGLRLGTRSGAVRRRLCLARVRLVPFGGGDSPRPATPSASKSAPAHPSARRPGPRSQAARRGASVLRGFALFFFLFSPLISLSGSPPPPPEPAPPPVHSHAARCRARQTMGSGPARQRAPRPPPHRGPRRGWERGGSGRVPLGSEAPPARRPRVAAAHSPARWRTAPPAPPARASAASEARCAP